MPGIPATEPGHDAKVREAMRTQTAVATRLRCLGTRGRTVCAVVGGVLAIVPAIVATDGALSWLGRSLEHTQDVPLGQGYDPRTATVLQIAVDGTLPGAPTPIPLPAYELPDGPLGIPATALAAYRNAADILSREQPACHLDWALIAGIGRIESNHARGGYVDAHGTTREPILGPALDGQGGLAAIPATDGGALTGDPVWDHAVGPMQFIPATWRRWASDGNGDGIADVNNLYDAALATGRYLCSSGTNLADPGQLRAAIYRYNASDTYVNTVILWAEAYRTGVLTLPDSTVPIGAPNAAAAPPSPALPPPATPTTASAPTTAPGTPITPTTTPRPPCASPTTTVTTTSVTDTTTNPPPPSTTSPRTTSRTPRPPTSTPTCGATVTVTSTTATTATVTTTPTPVGTTKP